MDTAERTMEPQTRESVFEHNRTRVAFDLSRLSAPAERTLQALNRKMSMLGRAEDMHLKQEDFIRPVPIAFGAKVQEPGHDRPTRLRLDLAVVVRLDERLMSYKTLVQKAAEGLWLSADAQCWGPEKCAAILEAVQKDAEAHTKDVTTLLVKAEEDFGRMRTYQGIVARAATLRADLEAMTEHLPEHLTGVARQAELAQLQRRS